MLQPTLTTYQVVTGVTAFGENGQCLFYCSFIRYSAHKEYLFIVSKFLHSDCCKYGCCHPLLCCACWCDTCAMGQIMQRLGLDYGGQPIIPGHERSMTTYRFVFLMTVGAMVIDYISLGLGSLALLVYLLIIAINTRRYLRRKYNIPTGCCGECEGEFQILCLAFTIGPTPLMAIDVVWAFPPKQTVAVPIGALAASCRKWVVTLPTLNDTRHPAAVKLDYRLACPPLFSRKYFRGNQALMDRHRMEPKQSSEPIDIRNTFQTHKAFLGTQ